MEKIIAIVVTYNRKKMLIECLESLFGQSRVPDKILVINNASTDGTVNELKSKGYCDREEIVVVNMTTNTGGAGGFYEGIRLASGENPDWVWVMDDDVAPEEDALENLLKAKNKVNPDASFYASSVYGLNNEPLNMPNLSRRRAKNGYLEWHKYLEEGCVEINDATFVSILINGKAIKKAGLPYKDYFIWGDDAEYTLRLTKYIGPAYLVGNSRVLHKRNGAITLDIRLETSKERIKLYSHFYENLLINRRLYLGKVDFLVSLIAGIRNAFGSLRTKHGFLKFITVFKGIFLHFINLHKVKKYIEESITG